CSYITAQVSLKKFAPRSVTTREGSLNFYFFKYLVFVIFFLFFNNLLAFIYLARCSDIVILYTILVNNIDLFIFQFFVFLDHLFYFLILYDLWRCKFRHFHFRRWRGFRRRRRR